jgi:hypothetical protein
MIKEWVAMPEGNEATRFKPGRSGNPKGRPKGSRHRISEAFLGDVLADYEKHGAATIERMRQDDPAAYVRMVVSLVPKQIENVPNPLEHFTDEELDQLEAYLKSIADKGESGADQQANGQPPH